LATAEQLTEQQLRQPFQIGQGSIWLSLTHLYAAEYVWLDALTGNENPLTPETQVDNSPATSRVKMR
jgi:uncharacterized damage-inducible protein DinB